MGRTCYSLALVFKQFYDLMVSTGSDTQSVQLCGTRTMQSFIRGLGGREQGRRRVCRLLLLDRHHQFDYLSLPSVDDDLDLTSQPHSSPASLIELMVQILRTIDRSSHVSLFIWLYPRDSPLPCDSLLFFLLSSTSQSPHLRSSSLINLLLPSS